MEEQDNRCKSIYIRNHKKYLLNALINRDKDGGPWFAQSVKCTTLDCGSGFDLTRSSDGAPTRAYTDTMESS